MTKGKALGPISALYAATASIQLLPGLIAGPNFDASVFLLIGTRLTSGALPYADLWDHKPPGIYLFDAAASGSLGWLIGGWPAVWLFSVLAHTLLGLAVFSATEGFVSRAARVIGGWLTVAISASWLFALGGGLTESFSACLAAIALALVIRSRRTIGNIAAGALYGLAVATSLFAAPAFLAVAVLAAWVGGTKRVVAFVFGAGLVVLVGLFAMTAAGVLPDAMDALVRYNGAYRQVSLEAPVPETTAISPWLVAWYVLNSAALIAAALLGAAASVRVASSRGLATGLLFAVVAGAAMIGAGGRLYGHYLILLMPFLGAFACIGTGEIERWLWLGSVKIPAAAASVVVLVVTVSATYVALDTSAPIQHRLGERDQEVAAYLKERIPQGHHLLVWGNAPMVYQLSGALPAWRYPYLLPLLMPGYVSDELVHELTADLRAAPPCYIVDAGSAAPGEAGQPPLLIDRPLTPSSRRLDLLDPIRRFVANNYVLLATVDGWPVYEADPGVCTRSTTS